MSDDGRWIVITSTRGTAPETRLRVLDRADPAGEPRALVADFAAKTSYVTNVGETFLLLTDDGAERGRIVGVALGAPGSEAAGSGSPSASAAGPETGAPAAMRRSG